MVAFAVLLVLLLVSAIGCVMVLRVLADVVIEKAQRLAARALHATTSDTGRRAE